MSTNWHNPSDIGLVTSLLPAGSVTSIGQSDGSPDITVVSLDGFLNTYKALYEEHQSLVSNREQLKAHYDERGKSIDDLRGANSILTSSIELWKEKAKRLEKEVVELKKSLKTKKDISKDGTEGGQEGSQTGGTSTAPDKMLILSHVIKKERALEKHSPKIYNGEVNQFAVVDFLDMCENFVAVGAGGGLTRDNRCIDVAIRHVGHTVRCWLEDEWAQNYPNGELPTDFVFLCTWKRFRDDFVSKWVTSAARTTTRREYAALRRSGDPAAFNTKCRNYIRMLTNGNKVSKIGRDDPLFEIYVEKMPPRVADIIMMESRTRSYASGNAPYSLSDAMLTFEEQSALGSSYYNSTTYTSGPPPRATNPITTSDPDAMDLSAIQHSAEIKCYRCTGFGHTARECATVPSSRDAGRRHIGSNSHDNTRRQGDRYPKDRFPSRNVNKGERSSGSGLNWRKKAINVIEQGDWSSAESSRLGDEDEEEDQSDGEMEQKGTGNGSQ